MEDVPHLSDNPDRPLPNETTYQCLARHVKNLEEYLRVDVYDEVRQEALLDAIRDTIDHDDEDQRTSLRALGYLPDRNDELIPSLMVIDTTEAYWREMEIRRVKDVERVVIPYEVIEDGHPAVYYVPPLAILSNEPYAVSDGRGNSHPIMRLIRDNADRVLEHVMPSSFFHTDASKQQAILAEIAKDLLDNLRVGYDADVQVTMSATEYYQILSDTDIAHIDWAACRNAVSDSTDTSYFQLDGAIVNVVYLETLEHHGSKMIDTNDFKYGHGLPCIIMAASTQGSVYCIPAASVVSVCSEMDNIV